MLFSEYVNVIYIVHSHLIYLSKLCIIFFFNSNFEIKINPSILREKEYAREDIEYFRFRDSTLRKRKKKAFEVFDINGFTRFFGTPPRGAFLVKFSSICQTKFFSFVSEHDFGVQILIIFRIGLVYLLDREF